MAASSTQSTSSSPARQAVASVSDAGFSHAMSAPADDTTAPSVAGNIAVPPSDAYRAGEVLSFTVTFNESVTVIGADSTLGLDIGGAARSATLHSSTPNSITYTYTVQAGDNDANGITVGAIVLGSTTIRDSAGNDAVLSLTGHVPSTAGILVDTTAPAVSGSVAVPANKTYVAGEHLDFTIVFDENVTVSGSDSTLGLTVGSTARSAVFLSAVGNTVTYRYTVQAGDLDANGIAVGALALGSSTIRDNAGNNAGVSLVGHLPPTSGVLVEALPPGISGAISVPADQVYVGGDSLSFTISFDENVTITGTASTLGLMIGGAARSAVYDSKTANSVTYVYTVQAGDLDSDGIAVTGLALNGGTIRDGAGNNANLSLAGHLPSTAGVLVDAVGPTVAISSDKAALKQGDTATITFTFSEAPVGFSAGDITVGGGVIGPVTGSGTVYSAVFTPTNNIASGSASIAVAAGAVEDAAGNGNSAGSLSSITFDTLAPTLAITSNIGSLKAGDTATVTFTFSENPGSTFTNADIVVEGGALSALTGSGLTRTAVFTPTALVDDGVASITVAAGAYLDPAGNLGGAGTTPYLTFDTLAPAKPSTPDLDPASDAGGSGGALTFDTTPTFVGTAEGLAQIELYEGASLIGSGTALANGSWSVTVSTPLGVGAHVITARAIDESGNTSVVSDGLSVTVQNEPLMILAGTEYELTSNLTIGGLSGTGDLNLSTFTLTIDQADDRTFSGKIIGDSAHRGFLEKKGVGVLTLTGDSDNSANIRVLEGVLQLTSGPTEAPRYITLGTSSSASTGRVILIGDTTVGYIGGYASSNGVIDLGAHDLTVISQSDSRNATEITGTGGFIKRGTNMYRLDGTNTFTGDVKVEEGYLRLANGSALADTVAVSISSGARLILETSSGAFAEKIGSISGAGEIAFNPNNILVAGDASDRDFSGRLWGTGTFKKVGSGELVLSGTSEAGVGLIVAGGDLVIDADVDGAVTAEGGVLSGTGTITGAVEIKAGATLSAGHSPGVLATGALKLQADAVLLQEVASASQVDQIRVTGGVDLGGAKLQTALLSGFAPTSGSWIIIDNDGADAVTGHFDGLAEGAQFATGGVTFKISYVGGDGNDVTLSVVAPPAPEPELPQPPAPPTEQELIANFAVAAGFADPNKLNEAFIRLANGLQIANPSYLTARAAEKLSESFAAGRITKATFVEGVVELSGPTSVVALQTYHLFTGSAPSVAGLAWLVDSPDNPTDLTDAYYALFNQANRFINFSINLGVHGEGKTAFEAAYAALSFEEAVRKAYETIIGFKEAQAAGIDTEGAVDWVTSQEQYFANISDEGDVGLYAGMLGYLLHEGNVAKVGKYYNAVRDHVERLVDGDSLGNAIADFYRDDSLPQDLGRPYDWSLI